MVKHDNPYFTQNALPESNKITGISSFLLEFDPISVVWGEDRRSLSSPQTTRNENRIFWEGWAMLSQMYLKGLSDRQQQTIRRVLSAALDAVDPRLAVQQALALQRALPRQGETLQAAGQGLDLAGFRRIRVVGAGKAALAMAWGALDVLGERVTDGLLIPKHAGEGEEALPPRIAVLRGGHPVPSAESVSSTRALERLLSDSAASDLVLCLISGGGSALMTLPAEGTDLAEMQELTRLLLGSGADIGEMNTLRKHLDRVKGGGLARMASPAQLVTLVLSDVIGSPLDVIASGPTVADPSTYADARQILAKYRLEERVSRGIRSLLERGARGELPETVKPGDPLLDRVSTLVVGSNPLAAAAGLAQAEAEGLRPLLLTTFLQGEAAQVGVVLAGLLKQVAATGQPLPRPCCIAAGGETTVTLRGKGLGGRNQELALGAAFLLSGLPDVALVTLGTDGEDGPTDAAGAVVTGDTLRRAREMGLDPLAFLQENDSYPFFQALGDLVLTGPTGTNVNDLVFLFAF
jgi:hydroxypyruvate reductase